MNSAEPQLVRRRVPVDFLFFDDLRRPYRVRELITSGPIWLHYWNQPQGGGNWVTHRAIDSPKELAEMAARRETSSKMLEIYQGRVPWHTPFTRFR